MHSLEVALLAALEADLAQGQGHKQTQVPGDHQEPAKLARKCQEKSGKTAPLPLRSPTCGDIQRNGHNLPELVGEGRALREVSQLSANAGGELAEQGGSLKAADGDGGGDGPADGAQDEDQGVALQPVAVEAFGAGDDAGGSAHGHSTASLEASGAGLQGGGGAQPSASLHSHSHFSRRKFTVVVRRPTGGEAGGVLGCDVQRGVGGVR
mmetsp:Transcript_18734/g.47310  ORF Transcript_18734/g.47310 Transcript_18734/m.47310 type:complete len:209 (-) Transcript_18734:21-647(-)